MYVTGAGREGIVIYTALDASQHTQHMGSVPHSDPSNKQPAQAAPRQPPGPASAVKPAATGEHGIMDKEHGKLSKGLRHNPEANLTASSTKGLQGTRGGNNASAGNQTTLIINTSAGKELQKGNGPGSSQQLRQPSAQAKQGGSAKGTPAHLPARQPQTSPAAVTSPQHQAQAQAAEAARLQRSSGQAGQAGPGSSPRHGLHPEEAHAPFGLFPSTQQSTSQQASKLTAAVMPADQAAPSAGATVSKQQQQRSSHMSPSGSSSARPPQGSVGRRSDAHTPSNAQQPASLGHQQHNRQQSQQATNAQDTVKGSGISQDEKQVTAQAAAAAAATKTVASQAAAGSMGADKDWISRRSHRARSAVADQPGLGGIQTLAPQHGGEEPAAASKQDREMQATDKAAAYHGKASSETDAVRGLGSRDNVPCGNEQQQQQQQQANAPAEAHSRDDHAGELSNTNLGKAVTGACKTVTS